MAENTIAELFKELGFDYNTMSINTPIDVSQQNIEVKSYDHKTHNIVFRKVLSIVRKHDAPLLLLKDKVNGNILLKGTAAHKVFNPVLEKYVSISEATHILLDNGEIVHTTNELTNDIQPILDIEVEETHCYFSNNILSHNTSGGNALKFYASQRVDIRKIGIEKMGEDIVGQFTKVKVVKNKIAPPFKEVEFSLKHGRGIDKFVDLIGCSVNKGLIGKAGSWYSYAGERLGQGEPLVVEWLKNNPEIFKKLYEACKE